MSPENPNWHSAVEAPLRISNADEIQWCAAADLVVVGFGGAGATAALRARLHGLDVIAIDSAQGGGATRASGGVYYAGAAPGCRSRMAKAIRRRTCSIT